MTTHSFRFRFCVKLHLRLLLENIPIRGYTICILSGSPSKHLALANKAYTRWQAFQCSASFLVKQFFLLLENSEALLWMLSLMAYILIEKPKYICSQGSTCWEDVSFLFKWQRFVTFICHQHLVYMHAHKRIIIDWICRASFVLFTDIRILRTH